MCFFGIESSLFWMQKLVSQQKRQILSTKHVNLLMTNAGKPADKAIEECQTVTPKLTRILLLSCW